MAFVRQGIPDLDGLKNTVNTVRYIFHAVNRLQSPEFFSGKR